MRVLVLCGAFALGVVAWACYTAGSWPDAGPAFPSWGASEAAPEAPAKTALPTGSQAWHRTRWVVPSEKDRPVLTRSGRFVRRVSNRMTASAVRIEPVSSRRRKLQQAAGAQENRAPGGAENAPKEGTIPPAADQAELQLAREFLAQLPETVASEAEEALDKQAPQQVETPPSDPVALPLQVVGPGAAEVILSLTDRFRNSVLRGSVFDPTGDPEQVESLSRELVQTIQELQARQPAAEASAPPPAEAEGAIPAFTPETADEGIAAVPVPPGELDPEQELVVRALRQASRHLEEAANDLEWSAHYHLADLLRETAAELRHRAREFQPPRD